MRQVWLPPWSLVPHFANSQRGLGSGRLLPSCCGRVAMGWVVSRSSAKQAGQAGRAPGADPLLPACGTPQKPSEKLHLRSVLPEVQPQKPSWGGWWVSQVSSQRRGAKPIPKPCQERLSPIKSSTPPCPAPHCPRALPSRPSAHQERALAAPGSKAHPAPSASGQAGGQDEAGAGSARTATAAPGLGCAPWMTRQQ